MIRSGMVLEGSNLAMHPGNPRQMEMNLKNKLMLGSGDLKTHIRFTIILIYILLTYSSTIDGSTPYLILIDDPAVLCAA